MSAIDAPRLHQILDPRRLALPPAPKVVEIRAEPYVDSTGDDALRIWVILDDATTDEELTGTGPRKIRLAIKEALFGDGIGLFPYTSFLKKCEYIGLARD